MKERPILFSGPMVRAILAGTKTQTRRIVKPQPPAAGIVRERAGIEYGIFTDDDQAWRVVGPVWAVREIMGTGYDTPQWRCPYGAPGDHLYVKEQHEFIAMSGGRLGCLYRADMAERVLDAPSSFRPVNRGRPSIHMPRWASRITLAIESVRVERLQEISEADAISEGITHRTMNDPRVEYRWLWESLNGQGSWESNPWIWVIEFRRAQPI